MQKPRAAAPLREMVRRPRLPERRSDAGIVKTKMTMPVTPEARNERFVLDGPAWWKNSGSVLQNVNVHHRIDWKHIERRLATD